MKSILKIYEIYQKKTKDLNAFDFGDNFILCTNNYEDHKDIREMYQRKIILIIFLWTIQDTNFIQNKWLNLLVNDKKNICCVGDDDQSIYSWRGLKLKIFLTFDQIYENCKVYY